jgi:hypothetical protein
VLADVSVVVVVGEVLADGSLVGAGDVVSVVVVVGEVLADGSLVGAATDVPPDGADPDAEVSGGAVFAAASAEATTGAASATAVSGCALVEEVVSAGDGAAAAPGSTVAASAPGSTEAGPARAIPGVANSPTRARRTRARRRGEGLIARGGRRTATKVRVGNKRGLPRSGVMRWLPLSRSLASGQRPASPHCSVTQHLYLGSYLGSCLGQ